jgi:putative transferase (TIGR04331 family)
MGYYFDGVDLETGSEARFFFLLNDMGPGHAEEADRVLSAHHLSLGDSLTDWFDETSNLTRVLYRDLIEDALEIFSRQGFQKLSHRKVEILVGHICIGLAQRVARSLRQLEKVPSGVQPVATSLGLPNQIDLEVPNSTADAMNLLYSDNFGAVVDSIVTHLHFGLESNFSLKSLPREEEPPKQPPSVRTLVTRRIYLLAQRALARKSRTFRISIVSSYLGKVGVIAIGFLTKQLPLLLEIKGMSPRENKLEGREVEVDTDSSLRDVCKSLLQLLIPSSILEHFEILLQEGLEMGFPANPSVIFTSNAFLYDDHFKVHVANNISTCLYLVAQHGSTYGVSTLSDFYTEIRTADYFLSWGWVREKVYPFGQIKPKVWGGFPKQVRGVTLFLRGDTNSVPCADMEGPYSKYFADSVLVCEVLNQLEIEVDIRLHNQTSRVRREFLERATYSFPFVRISDDSPSMARLLKSGRPPVFTYDSTGMLELASAGLPFFAFMQEGLKHVRKEFIENYRVLENAGLLSDDPIEAAHLIGSWVRATPDIRKLQKEAIKEFSKGIVFYPTKKLRSLSSLLLHASDYGEIDNWTKP